MPTDRKPWSPVETRALISLRNEMSLKFQTMKRNRPLWEELADKLHRVYHFERTATQCAVRWKNIIAAYKDSRECIKTSPQQARVCSFFKEVEAVLGDDPLLLPSMQPAEALRLEDTANPNSISPPVSMGTPTTRVGRPETNPLISITTGTATRRRDRDSGPSLSLAAWRHVEETLQAHSRLLRSNARALERIEKMLAKNEGVILDAAEIRQDSEAVLLHDGHTGAHLHDQGEAITHAVNGPVSSPMVMVQQVDTGNPAESVAPPTSGELDGEIGPVPVSQTNEDSAPNETVQDTMSPMNESLEPEKPGDNENRHEELKVKNEEVGVDTDEGHALTGSVDTAHVQEDVDTSIIDAKDEPPRKKMKLSGLIP